MESFGNGNAVHVGRGREGGSVRESLNVKKPLGKIPEGLRVWIEDPGAR
jgi:hypothetical protein